MGRDKFFGRNRRAAVDAGLEAPEKLGSVEASGRERR
jgi:hypothetical protein